MPRGICRLALLGVAWAILAGGPRSELGVCVQPSAHSCSAHTRRSSTDLQRDSPETIASDSHEIVSPACNDTSSDAKAPLCRTSNRIDK